MFGNWWAKIPKEDQEPFFRIVSAESSSRVRNVLLVLTLFQAAQMLYYILGKNSILRDMELIRIKLFIVLFSILAYVVLKALDKARQENGKYVEPALSAVVFVVLCWSVVNTFKAQSITSDISIYLLVVFAVSAVVRFRPVTAALMFGLVYLIFSLGISQFQHNPDYFTSHIMNGFILNIVAFLLSQMMLKYSFNEYQDKQKVNLKNTELLHLSRHDGLTSLYNHLTIYELLENSINHAKENSEPLSIMLIDLDHFKDLNDMHGHRAGDTVLKEMSESILRNIRLKDMAGRYGGDEFLIILPGSNKSNTKEIASRLLDEIRQLDFNGLSMSFSCGIAQWNGETTEQFVDMADRVLYRVKSDGRNNVYA